MPPENLQSPPSPLPEDQAHTPAVPQADAPQPQSIPSAPRIFSNQGPLKQIRTYQGDIADILQNKQESLVSIRTAELAKQSESPAPVERGEGGHPVRTFLFFVAALILIGGAAVAAWFGYQKYTEKTAVPVTVAPPSRLLPVVTTQPVDTTNLTRSDLLSLVTHERQNTIADSNIEQLTLNRVSGTSTMPLTSTELLVLLDTKAPGQLARALNPIFMLGILGQATSTASSTLTNAPFLIIKIDSYENAYAGMLKWEADLPADLAPLFVDTDTTLASDAIFKDVALKNKDTRELFDTNGKSVLIYTFYNQNLLIITANESALKTLLNELDTQALSR